MPSTDQTNDTAPTNKVMLIDRNPSDHTGMVGAMIMAGLTPTVIADEQAALAAIPHQRPSVLVIRRLPANVFRDEYCQRIRAIDLARSAGILVLLPRDARLTRVRCLEVGADDVADEEAPPDYIVSRVKRLIARIDNTEHVSIIRYGGIELSIDEMKVRISGKPIPLNLTSFEVLSTIIQHAEQVISKSFILSKCSQINSSRSLREHIRLIRKIMRPFSLDVSILTAPNGGYFLGPRAQGQRPDDKPVSRRLAGSTEPI